MVAKARIVLKELSISGKPFRKLKDITLRFSPRITLISGHNGVGKSTILGLIANTSGITQANSAPRSYFDRTFQANLAEIIFIDYEREFLESQEADTLPRPIITYEINGKDEIKKRCALTDRSTEGRARIVPRNFSPSSHFTSSDGEIDVGVASKVPLPTIYLGMTRVLPLGEAEEGSVTNDVIGSMPEEDRKLIAEFVNSIILGASATEDSVTSNKIKGTSKFSSHPTYQYDAKCVSLGQDSLGSIAAAVASFQMLKREWPKYPGGLLVIDELDSGFHPHAISRLVEQLEHYAAELDLQIVATTHSTRLIQAVHPRTSRSKNIVAYLMDTGAPYLMQDASLQAIMDDMDLVPPKAAVAGAKPVVRIYLEDAEALFMFNLLIPAAIKRKVGSANGVRIQPIAMGVGCNSLANLSHIDPHFRLSAFALDADATLKPRHFKHGNICILPGDGKKSPERTLFSFIKSLVDDAQDKHPETWAKLRKMHITTTQIQAHLLNWKGDLSDRDHAKKWWKDRETYIKDWKLFEAWMAENKSAVQKFQEDFALVAKAVAKRHRRLAKTGSAE